MGEERMMKAGRIVQNAYVVRDLDAACAQWHRMTGIGPFVGGVEVVLDQHRYRGRPADPIRLRGVFVQSGGLNIELIQLLSDGPCAFRDMFPGEAEGLHHSAMFCDDYAAERDRWSAAGYPVVSEFTTGFGVSICYIDTRPLFGHFLELYPEDPIIRGMYRQTVEEAEGWEGKQLIVPWR
ncbi:VOC family protein [Sphingobium phenoxybenzoativorans]|uniref:VOC family protein n=1 Tax=Sphingobium phenoxybenzoativorans TaxID=1592790 RepID=UPI000872120E|nr:VOC family protein [Sphingobium phenoxybenzoativorans]